MTRLRRRPACHQNGKTEGPVTAHGVADSWSSPSPGMMDAFIGLRGVGRRLATAIACPAP